MSRSWAVVVLMVAAVQAGVAAAEEQVRWRADRIVTALERTDGGRRAPYRYTVEHRLPMDGRFIAGSRRACVRRLGHMVFLQGLVLQRDRGDRVLGSWVVCEREVVPANQV